MDVMDAIYRRRAVRDFSSRQVERKTILTLIEAATQAPSAMNLQPWAFVVVSDPKTLAEISDHAKEHLLRTLTPNSPLVRLRDDLANPNFGIFYNAPVLVVICATSSEPGATEDCALAAQNFMLAAHANGLGTCWIGLAHSWLDEPAGKAMLAIPRTYVPVAPLILGYPQGVTAPHPRNAANVIWTGA